MRLSKLRGYAVILTAFFLCLSMGEQVARAQLASPLSSATGFDDSGTHNYVLSKVGSPSVTSIVGTGTQVAPGDDGQVDANIGFDFNFFAKDYTSLQVDGNGHVYLGTGFAPEDNYINGAATNGAHPENNGGSIHTNYNGPRIDFWWDDLDSTAGGAIYTETRGAAGSREFVVEYDAVPPFDNTYETSVQMVLHEGTSDITFNYLDFVPGTARNGLAIGIQGDPFSYFQYGWFAAGAVELPTGVGVPAPGESLLWHPTSTLPGIMEVSIDRVTGVVTLENNTGVDQHIKGYSITSPDGALNAPNATFLADSDPNWIRLSAADGNDLSEGHLTTGTISAGTSMVFGSATWLQYYKEDVVFKFIDDQGVTKQGPVTFTGDPGAGEVPFAFLDLNFDTKVDIQDWVTFKQNVGNDLAGMSIVEKYRNSDLDGDGLHGVQDFLIFKKEFDSVNGAGAFAAIVGVPEPSSMLLMALMSLGCVIFFEHRCRHHLWRNSMNKVSLVTRRLRPLMAVAGQIGIACCLLLPAVCKADVQIFFEDFEGLTLGDSQDEGRFEPVGPVGPTDPPTADPDPIPNVWTDVAPTGWTVDRSGVPGYNEPPENNGVKEWIGWNFADKGFWNDIAGQGRGEFTNATGTVMVADNDEWDDAPHPDSATNGWYNTTIDTPAIPLTGLPAGVVNLAFDSSWRPEFDTNYHQRVNITVSYDGAAPVEVLNWESDTASANYHPDSRNEIVSIDLDNPDGASSMVVRFGMFDAGNDWWWAVDNINVVAVGPPLDLIVDKATGDMSLNSGILPSTFNTYNITSAAGALNPVGWDAGNLASQAGGGLSADLDSDGDVDGADLLLGQQQNAGASFYADFGQQFGATGGSSPGDQWEVLNDTPNQLFEGFLNGDSTVAANSGQSIGSGYDTANGAEDLVFTYAAFGREVTGTVTYINSAATGAGVAVPEPSSLVLVLAASLLAVGMGWLKHIQGIEGVKRMAIWKKRMPVPVSALLGLALLVSMAQATVTVDRDYRLGDDSFEPASAGATVTSSFDSAGSPGTGTFIDLNIANGSPVYTTITGRPDGGTGLGVAFDGTQSQFLRGQRLGFPETSASSDAVAGGSLDYEGISNRGMQFWAKPGAASGAQTLVMDTNEHGVRINDQGNFSMRYATVDFDTNVPATPGVWRHIMVVVPDSGGAKMYIDGVGEAAAPGGYDVDDVANLVLGSNTAGGETLGEFSGGTEEFYTGVLDDLSLFVMGTTTTAGTDYGTFDFKKDNDFAAFLLDPNADPLDINGDGSISGDGTGSAATDDVTAFVDGWLFENRHNGITFGDLDTIAHGDINFDGITDLEDWSLLNAANPAMGAAVLQSLAAVPEPGSCLLLALAGLVGLPGVGCKMRHGCGK